MKPNADHKHVVTYTIRQKTTAPDLQKTVEAFTDELKLQYGSSVELVAVTWEDGRPPQTENLFDPDERYAEAMLQGARFHGPATDPMVAEDLDQGDREAIRGAAACVRQPIWHPEDLHSETTGRVRGW